MTDRSGHWDALQVFIRAPLALVGPTNRTLALPVLSRETHDTATAVRHISVRFVSQPARGRAPSLSEEKLSESRRPAAPEWPAQRTVLSAT